MSQKTWVETMPYPKGLLKWLFKTPTLLYRLGLGFFIGRLFMVMTTIGRKSGQTRRTPIEFHEFKGRKYVFSGWGTRTDWYRNVEAHPHITIQTWRGAESVTAHRLVADPELAEAFEFAMSNPTLRAVFKALRFKMTLEEFLAQKERFTFVTFEPTDEKTPPPLAADLVWVWAVLLPICLLFVWILR
jgi:deazaflavin-dependent oxidoreductase (nitroreductase family)